MEEIALTRFVDADVRAETLISVRAGAGLIELRLVLAEGEVDVVMTPADCQRLREALHLAAAHAQGRKYEWSR